jgi:hypothetical protein
VEIHDGILAAISLDEEIVGAPAAPFLVAALIAKQRIAAVSAIDLVVADVRENGIVAVAAGPGIIASEDGKMRWLRLLSIRSCEITLADTGRYDHLTSGVDVIPHRQRGVPSYAMARLITNFMERRNGHRRPPRNDLRSAQDHRLTGRIQAR